LPPGLLYFFLSLFPLMIFMAAALLTFLSPISSTDCQLMGRFVPARHEMVQPIIQGASTSGREYFLSAYRHSMGSISGFSS